MNARSFCDSACPASMGSRLSRCLPPTIRLASAVLLFALAAGWPVPARAQYMYLDSNGDGINTAADQLNPAEPTTFDIWLDTDSNRDGTAVVCAQDPSLTMSISSYQVTLRATGGSVAWTGFVNGFPNAGVNFGEHGTSTEYTNGYGGFTYQPPGLYRLASMTVTVLSGAPSIQAVASAPTLPDPSYTGFGSQCPGIDFSATCIFGRDWFDVDGLAPGQPTANHPPILAQPAAMTAPVGSVVTQPLAASDADAQPVTFSKFAGPGYLWVETVDPGRGAAAGEVVIAPFYSDVGTSSATVQVTDGVSTDQKSFDITVSPVPNHAPVLAPLERVVVVAGTVARRSIVATDADGQPLDFSRRSGPDWALVSTLNPGKGGATGDLRLAPSLHDLGIANLVVSATDGSVWTERPIEIEVIAPQSAPSAAVLPWPRDASGEVAVALGDLNNDGKLDLVGGGGVGDPFGVSVGRGDGTFLAASPDGESAQVGALAIGDLNGDGRNDVAAAESQTGRLAVLLGNGDGTLTRAAEYAVGSHPQGLALRDLNADGALDIVVANSGSGFVTVYLGHGDGTLGHRRDFSTGSGPIDIAVADFDADGRLDLATANPGGHSLTLLFGRGDGTFDRRAELPGGGFSDFVVSSDFNWDGIPDLAATDGGRGICVWIGMEAGGFQAPATVLDGPFYLCRAAATDWNADGNPDLLFTDLDLGRLTVLYGAGDGTFPSHEALGPGYWSLAIGDLNGDGFPDAAAGIAAVVLNQSSALKAVAARAFLENPNRAVSLTPSGPDFCIRLEPVDRDFENAQVDMASVKLSSIGTGTVNQIHALTGGSVVETDADRNGVLDLPVCFSGADLQQLFSGVKGRQTLAVRLDGGLATGQHFSASIQMTVIGTGKPFAVLVTPNPFNPTGTVTVTTSRDGFLRVRLYDVHGRVVRSMADVRSAPAGAYEYRVNAGENSLGSGIYFLRVETPEGILRTRLAILK